LGRIRRGVYLVAVVGMLGMMAPKAFAVPTPSPASAASECTPNTNVCFNQYASGWDSKTHEYVIRANVSEISLTFGKISARRAIMIFTHRYDPDAKKYVQYLVAQAPFCWQADCYVEWRTTNASEAQLAFWWGSTYNDKNQSVISKAGFPSGSE